MDILSALEASPSRGTSRCRVATFLDNIPEDTPGRDELVRLVETRHDRTGTTQNADTRSAANMAIVLTQLGFETTQNPIHDHRKHACRCYR